MLGEEKEVLILFVSSWEWNAIQYWLGIHMCDA